MDFRFQSLYEHALPPAAEQPVLARHESLHKWLLRATHRDPDRRFGSADEMVDQLAGVLREVVAGTVEAKPVESTLFGGDPIAAGGEAVDSLPAVKVDAEDAGASVLLSAALIPDSDQRIKQLLAGLSAHPASAELRLATALSAAGRSDEADKRLNEVAARDPLDWRVDWYRGGVELARNEPLQARAAFDRVYADLPGEPAVKLAVAVSAERVGDDVTAGRLYDLIGRTDPTFASAAFGLARCLSRSGRRTDAAAALRRVPAASPAHGRAQVALARLLVDPVPTTPTAADVCEAAVVVEVLGPDAAEADALRAEVLGHALSLLTAKAFPPDPDHLVFGRPLAERPIRFGLERSLRQLARRETDRARHVGLVDHANRVRPRALV